MLHTSQTSRMLVSTSIMAVPGDARWNCSDSDASHYTTVATVNMFQAHVMNLKCFKKLL